MWRGHLESASVTRLNRVVTKQLHAFITGVRARASRQIVGESFVPKAAT